MPIELVSAVESSRQLMDRLQAQRLQRTRVEQTERESQRVAEEQAARAQAEAAFAERTQLENVQNDRFENIRVQADRFEDTIEAVRAERVDNTNAADQRVDQLLADRARTGGLQTYRAQSEPPQQAYVLDAQQAERVQTTRASLERADASRIDRVDFSDQALSQIQFGY